MTDWWVVFGTGSLGLTVGWLVWTFVMRTTAFGLKALTSIVAICAGGAVLALWKVTETGALTKEANAYFVGVFLSALTLGVLYGALPDPDR